MNLTKLFETQKILHDRINYNEPDRFNKLILALLVELGECANEWRGFKFWSKDQESRTKVPVTGWGEPYKNPLLEEYVDGLHFVLDLGIEIDCLEIGIVKPFLEDDVTNQFNECFSTATEFLNGKKYDQFICLVSWYKGLGIKLGFTWEQIEKAYFEKNKENHARQDRGY